MGRGELAPGCERWWLNASAERGPLVQCTWFRVFHSYEIMTEIFLHVNKCKEPNVDQNLLYHGKKRHGHYWEWDAAVSLMESEEHFGVSSLIHSYFSVNESQNISPHLSCRTSGRLGVGAATFLPAWFEIKRFWGFSKLCCGWSLQVYVTV